MFSQSFDCTCKMILFLQYYITKYCKFCTPFIKFRAGVARNFKFGTRIDLGMYNLKYDKIPLKGAWWGPVAVFVNFVPFFINL